MVTQLITYNHTSLILEHRPVHILTIPRHAIHRGDKENMKLVSFTDYKGRRLEYIENQGSYIVDIPMEYRYKNQKIIANFVNKA